jgi:hypothetical protein
MDPDQTVQAGLDPCWSQTHYVGFVVTRLINIVIYRGYCLYMLTWCLGVCECLLGWKTYNNVLLFIVIELGETNCIFVRIDKIIYQNVDLFTSWRQITIWIIYNYYEINFLFTISLSYFTIFYYTCIPSLYKTEITHNLSSN